LPGVFSRLFTLVLLAAFAIGSGVSAHHAPSIYDTGSEKLITATVIAFEWVQPHTWTTLETTRDDGATVTWILEGMSPDFLGRRGWDRGSLKPGDVIDVAFYPRRDGVLRGMFIRARLPDGTLKVMAVTDR
jgi:hypothetical protein